ncbi:MAG: 4-hydroxybenzoate octaprenyltransferase [Pseudomonadales bacterium]|jgi:4-hydroxybenzoate polyprenyltransferase|nr:4-hydroxybenzoate octaprenyltransferase [Pseudomonadales bacterium]
MNPASSSSGRLAALRRVITLAKRRAPDFWQLARMHRPIGIYLLLWPTLWSLWIAAGGVPSGRLLLIFTLGTVCMRAAGCCINDYADRKVDGKVKRTLDRPIVAGRVSPREALYACAALCLLAFVLVLFTNRFTLMMSLGGLVLALCYPFAKRYTHLAQVVLGAAFSWGCVMAFTAATNTLPASAWLLYLANVFWTVMYDTEYAMVDRDDDLKIGVKSTAILFGRADRLILGVLQVLFLLTLALSAQRFGLGLWFKGGLLIAAGMFVYQQVLIVHRARDKCFQAFLHNNQVGVVIFVATVVDFGMA